jgi:predicted metal-dependent peptidase
MSRKVKRPPDPREVSWQTGLRIVQGHGLFRSAGQVGWQDLPSLVQARGYGQVTSAGVISCNKHATLDADEWAWVIAHLLLHRGLGHLAEDRRHDAVAGALACLEANRFLRESKIGREPITLPVELPRNDMSILEDRWRQEGVPTEFQHCGTGGFGPDIIVHPLEPWERHDWPGDFAAGIARAASDAIDIAGGARSSMGDPAGRRTVWERARGWFISSYPLLGGLAAQFTIVADADLARGWDISVAAVSAAAAEIYVNPLVHLSEAQWRFVLAHEMLHAALRHGDRVGGRDPYLWNVAADYVVNGWLVEMAVGDMPDGVLYDQGLAGLSVEAVYDTIATDLRRMRRLGTLRGRGLGDVLGEPLPHPGAAGAVDLDAYYRRALATGLAYHESGDRGLLPAGLVDEIRAMEHPPLPWDARLAQWFEEYVPMPERRRSYARPSRRQASTPDIPRPGWLRPVEPVPRCTFGVVIDTSGSMDSRLLGKALGAIASYATARDVPRARVVFCDAAAYDAGYVAVEDIAGRVKVRGRGGTVLQPGIDRLERADDFPTDAPILVITDAACDVVPVRRDHAFLIPEGARLPSTPRGPVFRMS